MRIVSLLAVVSLFATTAAAQRPSRADSSRRARADSIRRVRDQEYRADSAARARIVALRADSLARARSVERRADSVRIANRPCMPGDVLMNLCAPADTIYVDRKAVAVIRRNGTREVPARRVDTVYVACIGDTRAASSSDTIYVERGTGSAAADQRPCSRRSR